MCKCVREYGKFFNKVGKNVSENEQIRMRKHEKWLCGEGKWFWGSRWKTKFYVLLETKASLHVRHYNYVNYVTCRKKLHFLKTICLKFTLHNKWPRTPWKISQVIIEQSSCLDQQVGQQDKLENIIAVSTSKM